jgi:hypothetical protein
MAILGEDRVELMGCSLADGEALSAPIPRDRRATAKLVTSLRKPRFSEGHGGATAVEKDRQPRPGPELPRMPPVCCISRGSIQGMAVVSEGRRCVRQSARTTASQTHAVGANQWIAFVLRDRRRGSLLIFQDAVDPLRCAVHAARKPGVTNPWLPVERMRSTPGGFGRNFLRFCNPATRVCNA